VSIATYPGGGKTREPGEPVYKICESEVKTGGLVVTVEGVTTAGNVKVVDTDGATPFGVTVKSTEDPFDKGSFLKNQKIAIVQEGEVDLVLASVGTKIAGIREFDTLDIKWSFPGEVEGDYPIPEQAGVSISPPMPWTEFTMTLELAEVKYAITDWAKLRQLGQYQANFSRRRAVEKLAALKDENILSAIVAGVHSNLTITDVEDWDADTKTGDEIAADITAAIGKILQYSNVRETDIANMACIVPVDECSWNSSCRRRKKRTFHRVHS